MSEASAEELLQRGLEWVAVNDTVMGGVSKSKVVTTREGLRFSGELSLENNGGFTSFRSQPAPLNLNEITGFRVRVRGDGRTYDFTARRRDVPLNAGSYRHPVETVEGEEIEVEIPLSAFQATMRGRPVLGAPSLDTAPGQIESVGFLLADKSPGAFRLEVLSIEGIIGEGAESGDALAALDAVSMVFVRVIERGAPVYNMGDHGRCAEMYRTAIESVLILSSDSLPGPQQQLLQQALMLSSQQEETEAAWSLRRGMDAVLEMRLR
ncbi:MAG: CIA30 family protein [Myxococcota bacterium]